MVRVKKIKVKKENVIKCVRINRIVVEGIGGEQSISLGNIGKLNLM